MDTEKDSTAKVKISTQTTQRNFGGRGRLKKPECKIKGELLCRTALNPVVSGETIKSCHNGGLTTPHLRKLN